LSTESILNFIAVNASLIKIILNRVIVFRHKLKDSFLFSILFSLRYEYTNRVLFLNNTDLGLISHAFIVIDFDEHDRFLPRQVVDCEHRELYQFSLLILDRISFTALDLSYLFDPILRTTEFFIHLVTTAKDYGSEAFFILVDPLEA